MRSLDGEMVTQRVKILISIWFCISYSSATTAAAACLENSQLIKVIRLLVLYLYKLELNVDFTMDETKCSFCKKLVPKCYIREHTMEHVKPRMKTFKCETCDKSFVDNYKLKVHMTSHTGEKPFQCPSCGQSFRLKPMLKRHNDVHHTKTNLSHCDKCAKTFNTKRGLQNHLGSFHGEELGFKCEFCNSRFFSKEGLDAHRQEACFKHSCDECNKQFKIKSKLKHHKLIHHENI